MDAPASGQVGLGDERDLLSREYRPTVERRDDDVNAGGAEDRAVVGDGGNAIDVDALRGEDLLDAIRAATALGRDEHLVSVALEGVEPLRERVRVAHDRIERARREHWCIRLVGHGEHGNGLRPGVGEQPVERKREARCLGIVDLRAPCDRKGPCERRLLVEQLLRAVAQAPRLDDRDERGRRQEIGQQVLVGGQPRQPRLHAVEGVALREPFPLLTAPGMLLEELARAGSDLLGRQQLPHRKDPRFVDLDRRALIGNREP